MFGENILLCTGNSVPWHTDPGRDREGGMQGDHFPSPGLLHAHPRVAELQNLPFVINF